MASSPSLPRTAELGMNIIDSDRISQSLLHCLNRNTTQLPALPNDSIASTARCETDMSKVTVSQVPLQMSNLRSVGSTAACRVINTSRSSMIHMKIRVLDVPQILKLRRYMRVPASPPCGLKMDN